MKTEISSSNEKGFSLTEMIVVVMIITILCMVSASVLPIVKGMRFKNETVRLGSALVLARNLAMTRSKCVMVHVDSIARTLNIRAYSLPASLKCQGPLTNPTDVSTIAFEEFVNLGEFDNGGPLVFGPRGSTTSASVANIAIQHLESLSKMTFSVIPGTGKVSSK